MPAKLKIILRKSSRIALRGIFLVFLALFLLEVLFRYQIVDTYRRELTALNPDSPAAASKQIPVLVMGDSFSAAQDNWVDQLRTLRPDLHILNAAVPGTGIRQANFMARRRFKAQQPQIFIYQIYLGNDLFDLRYPLNWGKMGVFRNLYWAIANRFRSLSWLNYAMGQFRTAPPTSGISDGKTTQTPFAPTHYSPREKLYLAAEPSLIQATALLEGDRKADFADYLAYLDELLAYSEEYGCTSYLLLIPHCAQVSPRYTRNMQQLGAQIDQAERLQAVEYPFLKEIQQHTAPREKVNCFSLLPAFREMEKMGSPAYFNNDIHLSPAGQTRLATEMARLLPH